MPNLDIDNEFLELFYGMTNSKAPANVGLAELKQQLSKINELVHNSESQHEKRGFISRTSNSEEEEEAKGPAILVVDDLGVITYQLKVLLSKFEYDIDCSQEIYDAVNKFKKRHYDYVVMDLFIPTEREGFILLTELKKMAASSGKRCVIGIITASPRKEIELQCKARGADFFLEKNNDWQKTLISVMDEYINTEEDDMV